MGNADDSFLVNTLSTVFASVSALGASFRLDDDTDADAEADADPVAAGGPSHSSSPVSTCPIHFAHVDQAYARIINLGPTYVLCFDADPSAITFLSSAPVLPCRFAKALTYGISSLLAEGIYDPSNTSADIATALLIVLEVCCFSQNHNHTLQYSHPPPHSGLSCESLEARPCCLRASGQSPAHTRNHTPHSPSPLDLHRPFLSSTATTCAHAAQPSTSISATGYRATRYVSFVLLVLRIVNSDHSSLPQPERLARLVDLFKAVGPMNPRARDGLFLPPPPPRLCRHPCRPARPLRASWTCSMPSSCCAMPTSLHCSARASASWTFPPFTTTSSPVDSYSSASIRLEERDISQTPPLPCC